MDRKLGQASRYSGEIRQAIAPSGKSGLFGHQKILALTLQCEFRICEYKSLTFESIQLFYKNMNIRDTIQTTQSYFKLLD